MTLLLLDTHAYVWSVTEAQELSVAARQAVSDPSNTVLVSAASVWEMAIKHHAGKWPEAEPLLAQHDAMCARLGVKQRPIEATDAARAGALNWAHTDPFDRVLAAQAMLSHATLVSRDLAFASLPGLPVLW